MAKNDSIKLKGKGKKAFNKLKYVNKEINSIKVQLESANSILQNIINTKEEFNEIKDMQSKTAEPNLHKKRSMVKDISERIEFEFRNLNFYIDFTVVTSTSDDQTDLKGSIIYGTNRTLCFTKCIFPKKNKCGNCERIARCDRLEDKPLLQFTLNQNGLIKASGDIDDEWWIKEKEDLLDLHLRALDFIWGKALEWTNENILP